MSQFRWGFLGPGRIANAAAADLPFVDGAVPYAVGSRSIDRATAFAEAHGFERVYGSYPELIADPAVDAVYIATPHPQHHALALAAIRAGKAVLVEKAFTATLAGAREVVQEARAAGVFAMEAMWTRFFPLVARLRDLVAEGAIGEVRSVRADLGFVQPVDPTDRLWDPAQGGGALLDLGVYPVSFAQMLLGAPDRVEVVGSVGPTGVEAEAGLLLGWADGARALLDCSLVSPVAGRAEVVGTRGRIVVPPRFHHPTSFELMRDGSPPEVIEATGELTHAGAGYSGEFAELQRCVLAGEPESAAMPLDDTLAVMAVLEAATRSLGLQHAEDPSVWSG